MGFFEGFWDTKKLLCSVGYLTGSNELIKAHGTEGGSLKELISCQMWSVELSKVQTGSIV